MRVPFVALIAGLSVALSAGAPTPLILQPSTPWVVDYAEDSCILARSFGTGDQLTKMQIEADAPNDMTMYVTGKPLETPRESIPVHFSDVQLKSADAEVHETTDHVPAVIWTGVQMVPQPLMDLLAAERKALDLGDRRPPPTDLAQKLRIELARKDFADHAEQLVLDVRNNHPVILATGSMGPPMKAFNECLRKSLKDWGIDPAIEDKIARPAWLGDLKGVFSGDDYPKAAQIANKISSVRFRILIDATGKVTKCTTLSHFDDASFEKVVCGVLSKRAHFEPAELADGTKVPDYYTQTVTFRLER